MAVQQHVLEGELYRRVVAFLIELQSFGKVLAGQLGLPRGLLGNAEEKRTFRVAAIYADYSTDRGMLLIHRPVYAEAWNDPGVTTTGLRLAPDADYEATVWDLDDFESAGSITADVSGTSFLPALVVPIPLIARTQTKACKGLANQLRSFIVQ